MPIWRPTDVPGRFGRGEVSVVFRFSWLYLQTDCRDAEFVPAPDWYYNFEYAREIERGYEGDEDLLTTGYFELSLGRRQSVIFSASVEAIPDPAAIGGMFAEALSARSRKVDFLSLPAPLCPAVRRPPPTGGLRCWPGIPGMGRSDVRRS